MASANPKQKQSANNSFSYTSFDNHERLIEAGESEGYSLIHAAVFNNDYLPSDGYEYVLHKLLSAESHKDISHTWYDDYPDVNISNAFLNPSSFYLRNRVTASAFYNSTSNDWTTATNIRAFAYDEHGMVPEQVNILPELYNHTWSNPTSIFRTEYCYNLFSGLMDTVIYQRGKRDQFIHHYLYDQDQRIFLVNSSRDNVIWDKDARYIYYPHGPLARTELGHDKVQGVDYAYTLQGWLKMINGNRLSKQFDMGQDGAYGTVYVPSPNYHQKFAYDAYGFSLNYYSHGLSSGGAIARDYRAALPRNDSPLMDEDIFPFIATPDPSEVGQDLYNGNISGSTTTFYDIDPNSSKFGDAIPMASFYRYDQMNRLRKVQSYDHSINDGADWDTYTQDDRYQMELKYDLNGNILSLKRNGNLPGNLEMDRFNYKYYSLDASSTQQDIQLTGFNGSNTSLATNRLSLLEENISLAPPSNYDSDIDGSSGTGNINYVYDALGNLTQDLSEEIQEIKWNAYGKVVEVIRTATCQDKPDLVYVYDAFGQRIKKIIKSRDSGQLSHEKDWQETYYVRDVQGNVLAMYNHKSVFYSAYNFVSESINLEEWDLYGSSRLGTRKQDKSFDPVILASRNYEWYNNTVSGEYILPAPTINYRKFRILGTKTFELTNHLGSVISTISDRKLMIEDASNTGYVHHYTPEILSIGEQYAFGMSMPGRSFSVEDYRYGMNGHEKDNEYFGKDNYLSLGDFGYNPRTARRSTMELYDSKFPNVSLYAFCFNSPLLYADPDGKLPIIVINHNTKTISIYQPVWVITKGYGSFATEDIAKFQEEFDRELEPFKNLVAIDNNTGGFYKLSIKFEFFDGGTIEEKIKKNADWNRQNGLVAKGTFEATLPGEEFRNKYQSFDGKRPSIGTGGFTNNYKDVYMKNGTTSRERIHEGFHLLFLDDTKNATGIMKYTESYGFGPRVDISNITDALNLSLNADRMKHSILNIGINGFNKIGNQNPKGFSVKESTRLPTSSRGSGIGSLYIDTIYPESSNCNE